MIELTDTRALLAFIDEQRKTSGISEAALLRKAGVYGNLLHVARTRDSTVLLGNAIALINSLGFTVAILPAEDLRAMQTERKDAA